MEILKKILILGLFGTLAWQTACTEREEPLPAIGTPELFVKGSFNDQSFEYYAGDNGFTAEASSYFIGEEQWFAAEISNDEDFNFGLDIRSLESGSNIESSLEPGVLSEFKPDSIISAYRVEFSPSEIDSSALYKWDFGDGNTSETMMAVHEYPFEDAQYDVCLTITRSGGCVSTICQTIKPHLEMSLDIQTQNFSSGLLFFSPQISGFEAINYEWTLNNDPIANTKDIALQTGSGNAIWELCLKARSRQNKVIEKCLQINPTNNPALCTSNFDFTSNPLQDTIIGSLETRVYALDLALENDAFQVAEFSENSFEIVNSQPFENDPSGRKTQKIEFKANLRLVDNNGVFHHLQITDGALAVGLD